MRSLIALSGIPYQINAMRLRTFYAADAKRSHCARITHRANLLPAIAELEQNFLAMLAVFGCRCGRGIDFAVERYRSARHHHLARGRMVELHQVAVGARLLALKDLRKGGDV